jgi:acyl-CoA thioester hydrolase
VSDPYPVTVDVVVRWADMDALGHVNNTTYFLYFETVRIAYLERLGVTPPRLDQWDYGFIIATNSCRYRAPVTYPDTLSVRARVSALGDDRFLMEYEAYSSALDKVVADGETLVVSYDYVAGRRIPLPEEYRRAILALEGRELPPVPRRSGRVSSAE